MKIKYLIILLICLNANSQYKSINVVYKTYPTNKSIEKNEGLNSPIFLGVDEAISFIRYNLSGNQKNAIFTYMDRLYEDKKALKLARSFTGSDDYFIGLLDSIHYKKKIFSNKLFYIRYKNELIWENLNETKKIDSLICFKATTKKQTKINNKTLISDVVAWYCPDIPFQYGPKNYCGLPGLILELQEDKITYLAEKIDFTSVENDFLFKDKDKSISEKEFETIVDSEINEMLNIKE